MDLPPILRALTPLSAPGVNPFVGDPSLSFDDENGEWPRAWGGTNFSNCITPCIRKYTAADVVAGAFAPVSEAYLTGPDAECPRAWRVAPGGALLLAWSSTLQ